MNVGFIGYSPPTSFDEFGARALIKYALQHEMQVHTDITVVSGATALGVPKLAYEEAQAFHLPTIGVMCKEGEGYEVWPVDKLFTVGEHWGDESAFFLSMLDKLYRIGGGVQSLAETAQAKQLGIPVIEYNVNVFSK